MHHLFAQSHTFRIKLTFGLNISNVISTSPYQPIWIMAKI